MEKTIEILVPCKGLFFRHGSRSRITKRKAIVKIDTMEFLKEESCTGCDYCNPIIEHIQDELYCVYQDTWDNVHGFGGKYRLITHFEMENLPGHECEIKEITHQFEQIVEKE